MQALSKTRALIVCSCNCFGVRVRSSGYAFECAGSAPNREAAATSNWLGRTRPQHRLRNQVLIVSVTFRHTLRQRRVLNMMVVRTITNPIMLRVVRVGKC